MQISTILYRISGAASFVVLFANVYKHGWQWGSVSIGVFLTLLMFSLAVPPDRRTIRWEIRYLIAVATVLTLAVRRFLI
jgi:hypothetical protein